MRWLRRLLNLATALCILACMGIAALWLRSHWVKDAFQFQRGAVRCEVASQFGSVWFSDAPQLQMDLDAVRALRQEQRDFFAQDQRWREQFLEQLEGTRAIPSATPNPFNPTAAAAASSQTGSKTAGRAAFRDSESVVEDPESSRLPCAPPALHLQHLALGHLRRVRAFAADAIDRRIAAPVATPPAGWAGAMPGLWLRSPLHAGSVPGVRQSGW